MTPGVRSKGNGGVSVTLLGAADGGSRLALSLVRMPTEKGVRERAGTGLELEVRERWRGSLLPPTCPLLHPQPQITCSMPDTEGTLP